jgi:hypothetical protein
LDAETARRLVEPFLECVVAPDCTPEAAELLSVKKNLRVLILPDLCVGPAQTIRTLAGGFLVQEADRLLCRDPTRQPSWQVVTQRQPTPEEWADLEFAWIVCKHVKSNAIVVAKQGQTLGVGAGQMNRVGAVEIALQQAGSRAAGSCFGQRWLLSPLPTAWRWLPEPGSAPSSSREGASAMPIPLLLPTLPVLPWFAPAYVTFCTELRDICHPSPGGRRKLEICHQASRRVAGSCGYLESSLGTVL